ncbi:MAG: hypothetical protein Q8S73_33745 [Deltaproteobacteria bacterium]|nr:hypothetical protein [Myxococcales bacterium]MDP3219110.1 hypothetical protein [Deltaproteobacteria bacterium]
MLTIIVTLATLGFTSFIMWKTFLPMIANANRLIGQIADQSAERNQLLAQGAPGNARVISLEGTGTLVNNAPQVVIGLEVHPATGGAPFLARCVSLVSQLQIPQVQPGCMVPVRFDPGNVTRIALAI